jgi:hypothetical protein
MFPFPFSGLHLVHDKKVHDAMERARIDAELVRGSRRTVQMYQLRNVLRRTISKLNIFFWIGILRRRPSTLAKGDTRDSR